MPRSALDVLHIMRFLKILQILGSFLGVSGIFFVVFRLSEYTAQIDFADISLDKWGYISFWTITYGIANILLALAWLALLNFLGVKMGTRWAVQVYSRSHLARYLPGNVFHLAGRQALGMAHGLPGWVLVKSSAWEIGLIIVAGIPFCFLALPFYWDGFPIWLALALYLAMIAGLAILSLRRSVSLSRAFLFQVAFLIISGAVFCGIVSLIAPGKIALSLLPALCGAYTFAWLAGLVTPGAPAGAGIRELALLFLLGGHIPDATLLLAIVLGRMVTILGDLLFFIVFAFGKVAKKTYSRS
jgi:hypothetical protein